jgi:hypothetical protein
VSWAVIARQDFLSHYVFGASRSYDMLGLLYGAIRQGDHLDASVDAASLAFMAARHSSVPHVKRLAAERYVVALQLVNAALAAADAAVADDTLQAVLLLDLYEKLVSRDPRSATSWLRHMNGAIALIEMRGQRNLDTYVGRRLAQRLYTCLVISCGVAGVRVPGELCLLKDQLDSFYRTEDPKWVATTLNVQAIDFVADVRDGKYSGQEIVAQARRLDDLFRDLQESLPESWRPRHVNVKQGSVPAQLVLSDGYDVYKDPYHSQVWNVTRIMRINLHLITAQHSKDTPGTGFIEESIDEICASATQAMAPDASCTTGPFSLPQSLKCCSLLAPLYLAGQTTRNAPTRDWVSRVLEYMAGTGGLELAHRTAAVLETSPSTSFWDVYAMLGSYAFAA